MTIWRIEAYTCSFVFQLSWSYYPTWRSSEYICCVLQVWIVQSAASHPRKDLLSSVCSLILRIPLFLIPWTDRALLIVQTTKGAVFLPFLNNWLTTARAAAVGDCLFRFECASIFVTHFCTKSWLFSLKILEEDLEEDPGRGPLNFGDVHLGNILVPRYWRADAHVSDL